LQKAKFITLLLISGFIALFSYSFKPSQLPTLELFPTLSEYNIYIGKAENLIPSASYFLYEIASPLFTDYAEKQRLISLPIGKKLNAVDNNLLLFPEGTILVKTFFYYVDKRDTSLGKKLVETRILLKTNKEWLTGTYEWNTKQTEAFLTNKSPDKTINWTNLLGQVQNIEYHIPSTKDCKTCHLQEDAIQPIGLKTQNLNFDVLRANALQNQLKYLEKESKLKIQFTPFEHVVNYLDTTELLNNRARAYLDINCAHCHNPKGSAASKKLDLNYSTTIENTKILSSKEDIIKQLEKQKMPKIGTTVLDKEGITLIKRYLGTLN